MYNFRSSGFLIVLIVAVATSIIVASSSYADPFSFSNMAISAVVDANGRITINPFPELEGSNVIFRNSRLVIILLPVFLNQVTGLPLDIIHFLPITGILLPVLGYIMANRLLGSGTYAAFFGLFLALSPSINRTYNIDTFGYGSLFFMLMVIVSVRQIKAARGDFILLITFYIMTILSYYKMELHSFVYLLTFLLLSRTQRFRSVRKPKHMINTNTILICLTTTFLFDPLIEFMFENPRDLGWNLSQVLRKFLESYTAILGSMGENVPVYHTTPRNIVLVDLVLSILILIPAIYYFFSSITRKDRSQVEMFFYCIIVVALADIVAYTAWTGWMDAGYITFIGSVWAIIGLDKWFRRRRSLRLLYMSIVVINFAASFALFTIGPRATHSLLEELAVESDYMWVSSHSNNAMILTSTPDSTRLVFASATSNTYDRIATRVYDEPFGTIEFLYSGGTDALHILRSHYELADSILLNRRNYRERLWGLSWTHFPALRTLDHVYDTPGVNVVFQGSEAIFLRIVTW